VKFRHPASGYAVLGAAAIVAVANGACTAARVAIGGLLPAAVRCAGVEGKLQNQPLSQENVERASAEVRDVLTEDAMGDIYASAEYRKAMAPVYIARALRLASSRCPPDL
jgi:carbon-monoxide dehydrogenase medium subunit